MRLQPLLPARWVIPIGLALFAGAIEASQPLPEFVETQIVSGGEADGATKITSIAWEPGGTSLWITEQGPGASMGTARLRRYHPDVDHVTTALTLDCVDSTGERGMLSVAFHPRFDDPTAGRRWVYLYYTRQVTTSGACAVTGVAAGPHATLSRFDEIGGTLINEQILLVVPHIPFAGNHNGGRIVFDSAENLFLSIGDHSEGIGGDGTAPRDLGKLVGKILRLDENGQALPDNPFVDDPGARDEVWAIGLRNPFKITLDLQTDTLYIADVGEANWEALYIGTPAADYGWPCVEGSHPLLSCDPAPAPGAITDPIYEYHHGALTLPVEGTSITGGPVYRHTAFPANYEGRYFFADFDSKWIRSGVPVPGGGLTDVELFATGANAIVDLIESPNGCLTWASYFQGVYDICFEGGGNTRPSAQTDAQPDTGLAPLDTILIGSNSTDLDTDPLTYSWDFGDGGTSTDADPLHQYPLEGVYTATLTVDDGTGTTNSDDSDTHKIVVGNRRPRSSIDAPQSNSRYNAGDTIDYQGFGYDDEELVLPLAALTWTIAFQHNDHSHPFLGPISGIDSGSFTIPTTGESSANTWYRITLGVTDTGVPIGPEAILDGNSFVEIFPNVSRLKLIADPPLWGLQLGLDGSFGNAPVQLDSVVNFPRQISAPAQQTVFGASMLFDSWSIGGAADQTIPAPAGDTTLIANYTCRIGCRNLTRDNDKDELTPDEGDCNDNDDQIWGRPAATTGLRWMDGTTLNWDQPSPAGGTSASLRYDAIRSPSAREVRRLGQCLESQDTDRSLLDLDEPSPGELFFYLIRAVNDCPGIVGDLGQRSDARERLGPDCSAL